MSHPVTSQPVASQSQSGRPSAADEPSSMDGIVTMGFIMLPPIVFDNIVYPRRMLYVMSNQRPPAVPELDQKAASFLDEAMNPNNQTRITKGVDPSLWERLNTWELFGTFHYYYHASFLMNPFGPLRTNGCRVYVCVCYTGKKNAQAPMLCVYCQENAKEGESVTQLPCKHLYHTGCIKTWFSGHTTCPTCREPVTDSNT